MDISTLYWDFNACVLVFHIKCGPLLHLYSYRGKQHSKSPLIPLIFAPELIKTRDQAAEGEEPVKKHVSAGVIVKVNLYLTLPESLKAVQGPLKGSEMRSHYGMQWPRFSST